MASLIGCKVASSRVLALTLLLLAAAPLIDAGSSKCGRGSKRLCRSDFSEELSQAQQAGASYLQSKMHVAGPRNAQLPGQAGNHDDQSVVSPSLIQARTTRTIAKLLPTDKKKKNDKLRNVEGFPVGEEFGKEQLPQFNPFTPDSKLLR
eukprot:TRINITY_DN122115_c0_g1_i1.p1 TRINITY_DN122115_c0_g1~~TRINITY_DN122115_c0_g1_i1.p1  ORF type:complete len:149 (-),score=32.45 TRINITY_DN122115_c0_g1_i1:233-679(-)